MKISDIITFDRIIKSGLCVTLFFLIGFHWCEAQQVFACQNASISFFSSAPIEDIEALSDKGVSAINISTGAVYFKVAIATFEFEKSLMQKHFNTEYMQSDIYPYAVFKGTLEQKIPIGQEGVFPVTVKGELTIHGVSKLYEAAGFMEIKANEIGISSSFNVRLADHQIKIPRLLMRNIAEAVAVKVSAVYQLNKNTPEINPRDTINALN